MLPGSFDSKAAEVALQECSKSNSILILYSLKIRSLVEQARILRYKLHRLVRGLAKGLVRQKVLKFCKIANNWPEYIYLLSWRRMHGQCTKKKTSAENPLSHSEKTGIIMNFVFKMWLTMRFPPVSRFSTISPKRARI